MILLILYITIGIGFNSWLINGFKKSKPGRYEEYNFTTKLFVSIATIAVWPFIFIILIIVAILSSLFN